MNVKMHFRDKRSVQMTNKEKHQERFIQKSRFKARVKKLRYFANGYTSARLQGMAYHTRALCSCPMCGNSRTHFGELTVQEKSSVEIYNLLKNYKDEE